MDLLIRFGSYDSNFLENPYNWTVFNRIRIYRRKMNFSQSQLAYLCGVSKNCISDYENNLYQPRLDRAVFLMKYLDCSFEDLFYTVQLS